MSGRTLGFTLIATAALLLARSDPARAADAEEAQYNAVVALYNAGQWQAAITKIEEREKLSLPDVARARYLYAKGLAYERGNKPVEARAAYEQLLGKHPQAAESQPAAVALIYLDYATGRSQAVVSRFEHLDQNRLEPAVKKSLSLMYAESLLARQDPRALAAYQAAIALGVDAGPLGAKLFGLRLQAGRHAELLTQTAGGVVGVQPDLIALARAESLLALGRWTEVEAEATKVPATSNYYPRASFARAQALVKQGKLKEALAPLQIAVDKLTDPPAPPAARLALAECLLESARPAEVSKVLAPVESAAGKLAEPERTKLRRQSALLRVRAAAAVGDARQIAEAVGQAREHLSADQLSRILYVRLFALAKQRDDAAVLDTMKDDLAVLQKTDEDGPATMIYADALRRSGRTSEASQLLEELVARRPGGPEALRAQLTLAAAAVDKSDYARARALLDAVVANPKPAQALGKAAYDEALFNRAVVLQKLGDHGEMLKSLTTLIAGRPTIELERQALPLFGQAYAAKKDYPGAARVWKQALAEKKYLDEADLRDRLARVLFAAGDNAGASEQFAAIEKLSGPEKLGRDAVEMWAQAQFAQSKFPEAAATYQRLAQRHSDCPNYAYECAVAWERAGRRPQAIEWYAVARQQKDKLPAAYSARLDASLAALQLEEGQGDLGLAIWLDKLRSCKDEPSFETAIAPLRRIAAAGKIDLASRRVLEGALGTASPDQPRRYALGGIVLAALAQDKTRRDDTARLAAKLAAQLAENESKLNPKSSGATLGAAMIYFYQGEAQRAAGQHADALAAYETVLAAYPYNQWPDAAACGAAECYLALGDAATARQKLREVAEAKPSDPAAAVWQNRAKTRLIELEKGK